MCLSISAQPIKFIVLFMVISCQGNFVNSVRLVPQEVHSANKPSLAKDHFFFLSQLEPNI